MNMISEQVAELRMSADIQIKDIREMLYQSADTIESISAKLQAANMERSERYYNGSEDNYTVEQILDAITQADEEVISAIRYKDRDMLEDVLKDYLHK